MRFRFIMDVIELNISQLESFEPFNGIYERVYTGIQLQLKQQLKLDLSSALTAFVVMNDNDCLARLIVFKGQSDNELFLGAFESINDVEVVQKLMDSVLKFAKQKEVAKLVGPIDGSTWNTYRFPVKSEMTFLGEPNYPLYYHQLWEKCGWETSKVYYSFEVEAKWEKTYRDRDFNVRGIELDKLEAELASVHGILDEAFEDNPYYDSLSQSNFIQKYSAYKSMINPQWVKIIEDRDKKVIGFAFCYVNPLNPEELIFKTLARDTDKKYKGFGAQAVKYVHTQAEGAGLKKIVHALMVEGNGGNATTTKHFEPTLRNEYHLYELDVK